MKAGTSERFDCPECSYEIEVCYEPKARDNPKAAKGMPDTDGPPSYCPFCGTTVESESDDE